MKRTTAIALGTATSVLALPAVAHPFHVSTGGFAAGFAHPVLGLDHLLAMVAVGIWAVQQGGTSRWRLPIAFCGMMAVGIALARVGVQLPIVEPMIAASVLVLGLAITSAYRLAPVRAMPLVGLFAVFHGFAHGVEQMSAVSFGSIGGILCATIILHVSGMIAAGSLRSHVRMTGAPLLIAGGWLLSRTFI
jgi:urease accessory protein